MSLHTRINFGVQARISATVAGDVGAVQHSVDRQLSWESGTGADEADVAFAKTGTLSASAALVLDFNPGPDDAFGNPATMARLKAVYVENTGSVASIAVIGTNAIIGAGVVLRPGESFLKAVGPADATAHTAAAGSTDTVTITNQSGSNAAAYRVVVVGASA